jgi:hypothetical protein
MSSEKEEQEYYREPAREHPSPQPDSGVDDTLIRWMISLSPEQRLQYLARHMAAMAALRNARPAT